ncbi:hypothetical protein L2E82_48449 [Cichorium intybus]|uniref:Uncharacterized protein n=1 Tax=Cichorium intybus TaxID=13427 RepID=A0ACB8YYF0_CICIN|nr:hypothetical protein L2E82_48449 [Cichorium intybus]
MEFWRAFSAEIMKLEAWNWNHGLELLKNRSFCTSAQRSRLDHEVARDSKVWARRALPLGAMRLQGRKSKMLFFVWLVRFSSNLDHRLVMISRESDKDKNGAVSQSILMASMILVGDKIESVTREVGLLDAVSSSPALKETTGEE